MMQNDWFVLSASYGVQYTVTVTVSGSFVLSFNVYNGSPESLNSLVDGYHFDSGSVQWTAGADETEWIQITGFTSASYTLTVTSP
ncbi:MAG: hypothetical protein U0793_19800 [Gemmataceae bacterium]